MLISFSPEMFVCDYTYFPCILFLVCIEGVIFFNQASCDANLCAIKLTHSRYSLMIQINVCQLHVLNNYNHNQDADTFTNLKVPLFGNCLLSHPQLLAENDLISLLIILLYSEYQSIPGILRFTTLLLSPILELRKNNFSSVFLFLHDIYACVVESFKNIWPANIPISSCSCPCAICSPSFKDGIIDSSN